MKPIRPVDITTRDVRETTATPVVLRGDSREGRCPARARPISHGVYSANADGHSTPQRVTSIMVAEPAALAYEKPTPARGHDASPRQTRGIPDQPLALDHNTKFFEDGVPPEIEKLKLLTCNGLPKQRPGWRRRAASSKRQLGAVLCNEQPRQSGRPNCRDRSPLLPVVLQLLRKVAEGHDWFARWRTESGKNGLSQPSLARRFGQHGIGEK
jgi:hypothetical protein